MKPRLPYNWPPTYPPHWVWTGWDGWHRLYRDGTLVPLWREEDAP